MTAERKALHAYLTPEAHDRWQTFAEENGISLSGLLEASADEFFTDRQNPTPVRFALDGVVKSARKIDAARRRRGKREPS